MIATVLPTLVVVLFTIALWGRLTPGVVVSAVVVGVALSAPWRRRDYRLRPTAALVALLVLTAEVLRANVAVLRDILRPDRDRPPAVVDVVLEQVRPPVDALVAWAVTLTPGTAVLSLQRGQNGTTVVRVHVLRLGRAEDIRRQVVRFEELAAAAVEICTAHQEAVT